MARRSMRDSGVSSAFTELIVEGNFSSRAMPHHMSPSLEADVIPSPHRLQHSRLRKSLATQTAF